MNKQAVQKVIDAWVIKGKAPWYHRQMQRKLEREWPVLANAIKELVNQDKGSRKMAYTKKELFESLSHLDDDAEIEIEIITYSNAEEGVEEGTLYELEAVAISGTRLGSLVGYDCQRADME